MEQPAGEVSDRPPLDYAAPRKRHGLAGRLSPWQLAVVVVTWVVFGVLTLYAMRMQMLPWGRAAKVAVSVALGPMAGAYAAGFQSCCVQFSLSVLPWCAGALAGALAVQLLVPPRGWPSRWVRVLSWLAGVFAWFAGAIVSFLHALS